MYREIEIKMTLRERLQVVAKMVETHKDAVEKLLKNGGVYGCPFPEMCKRFPCEDMWCNADVCSNEYAYRMS